MMKTLIMGRTFLIICLSVFLSCSKEKDTITPEQNQPPTQNNNQLPGSFTQRALLETFTGTWCSTCPESDYKRDQVTNTYPGRVISVTIHTNDSMASPSYPWYFSTLGVGIPSGMISRLPSLGNVVLNSNQWMSNATAALNRIANCGLSISSSISGLNATIEVKTGFIADLSSALTLSIYLVEDKIIKSGPGWNQSNGFNTSPGSLFYNQGNPINNYQHDRVVRKILTATGGDVIPSSYTIKNGIYTKTFNTSINGFNSANTFIVAFITKTGNTASSYEVLNVQTVKLGQAVSWN